MKRKYGGVAGAGRVDRGIAMRIIMRMKNAHKPRHVPRTKTPARSQKRAVNLSVDADLVAAAREQGLNLSQVLDDALRQRVAAARADDWARENRQAIEDYNARVERNGIFGRLRRL
jgi:antitoxin CcdA